MAYEGEKKYFELADAVISRMLNNVDVFSHVCFADVFSRVLWIYVSISCFIAVVFSRGHGYMYRMFCISRMYSRVCMDIYIACVSSRLILAV